MRTSSLFEEKKHTEVNYYGHKYILYIVREDITVTKNIFGIVHAYDAFRAANDFFEAVGECAVITLADGEAAEILADNEDEA